MLVFVLVLGWTIQRASLRPVRNWDMLCYAALALEWSHDDPVEVHRLTYAAAEERLPPRIYQSLLYGGFQVRLARYRDPEAFTEHLAFYRARVLYTGALFLLNAAGAPLIDATWWISLASWGALALLALLWTSRYLPVPLAALLALGLVHSPPLIETARYSTPDALTALLTCAGVYLLAFRRSPIPAAVVLTATILARPDSVILIGFLAVALLLLESRETRPSLGFVAVWLGASGAAYLAVQELSGHYGWWPVFWITFVQKEVHPGEIPTRIDWPLYLQVMRAQAAKLVGSGDLAYALGYVLPALAGILLWLRARMPAGTRRLGAILIALLATFFVRYPLFPVLWPRFLAPLYVLVPLLLLSMFLEGRRSLATSGADDRPEQPDAGEERAHEGEEREGGQAEELRTT